ARLSLILGAVAADGLLQTITNNLRGFFVYGDVNPLHNIPGRPYLDPLSGLVVVFGLIEGIRRFQEPRFALPVIMFGFLMPVAMIAPAAPNFMGYAVLLPLLALFFAVGVKRIAKVLDYRQWVYGAVSLLLIFNLAWTVQGLVRWTLREDVQFAYHAREAAIARYLDNTVSSTSTVVCAPTLPISPTWLADVDNRSTVLSLMLGNPNRDAIRYVDCGSGMVFTNGGNHQQVIILREGGIEALHPYVRDWVEQGDLIQVGVPTESVVSMIVSEALGDTIGRFTTTAPAGFAPESPGGVASALLPVSFDGNLTFLGYDRSDDDNVYAPGDIVTVITYWRVDNPLPNNLNIFTHLLFDAETLVTQTDTISVQASQLDARDVFIQVSFITLPPDIPEGAYQLSIGAYRAGTETRLSVLDNGAPRGNRLFLNEVRVDAPTVATTESSGGG
ncbi:MAG: hypothetical protein AAF125_14760, partial [Chloroflexota bacterium]